MHNKQGTDGSNDTRKSLNETNMDAPGDEEENHKSKHASNRQSRKSQRASVRTSKVGGVDGRDSTVLSQPLTYLPENLEKIGVDAEKGGCKASTAIAASSWNAMAGLGMVSMPWAFQ